ncbi:class I lanthipeptide [Chitinophaga sp.]|uniref:class I lanthipeptide n=1 Tax=Chitinophaga sp. TaxID=1869181 RepID=UPI0031D40911
MKKVVLNPLSLDKETIAKLDEKQLLEITGGVSEELAAGSTGCGSGASTCGSGGSTGCGSGASTCFAEEE